MKVAFRPGLAAVTCHIKIFQRSGRREATKIFLVAVRRRCRNEGKGEPRKRSGRRR